MAKIRLSEGGYTPIPEGKHIFKIISSNFDSDFGKLEVGMVTAGGQKHTERFSLVNNDGEVNEGANKAFSYFAKTALNNFNIEEIDTDDIVDCYIEAKVEHEVVPSNKDPKKTVTFVRLAEKYPASGFGESAKPAPSKPSVSLDDLLG